MFNADDLGDFDVDFDDEALFNVNDAVLTDPNEKQRNNLISKNVISSQFVLRMTKQPEKDVDKVIANVNVDKNNDLRCVATTSSNLLNGSEPSNSEKRKLGASLVLENNLKNKTAQQRKFPGPAGLLPDKPLKDLKNVSTMVDPELEDLEEKNESVILYSQTSASVFDEPPYLKLLSDFDMAKADNPLNKYTIDWVKKKVVNKTFSGKKIPFLAVVLHHVDHSSPDPVVLLRDPTGEIHGTFHREVWNEIGGKFHPGAALALRQVGVFSVSRRHVYLNITVNNILSIYTSFEDSQEVEKNCVNDMSSSDLLKSIDEWQTKAAALSSTETPERNTSNNSLFFCINNQDSPNLLKRKLNQSTPIKKPNLVTNRPGAQVKSAPPTCDFDISMDDINFDEFTEEKTPEKDQNKNTTGIKFTVCEERSGFAEPSTKEITAVKFTPQDNRPAFIEPNKKTNGAVGFKFTPRDERPTFVEPNKKTNDTAGFKFTPTDKRPTTVEQNKKSKEFSKPKQNPIFSQVLTQEESQMVEEVLDGIDLDDFDL